MDLSTVTKLLDGLTSIEDITAVHGSLRTICDVTTAITCQPRHFDDRTKMNTPSGDVIGALCDYLNEQTDLLVRRIEAAKPQNDWDRRLVNGMLIEHEASCGTDAARIATIAANLAATAH